MGADTRRHIKFVAAFALALFSIASPASGEERWALVHDGTVYAIHICTTDVCGPNGSFSTNLSTMADLSRNAGCPSVCNYVRLDDSPAADPRPSPTATTSPAPETTTTAAEPATQPSPTTESSPASTETTTVDGGAQTSGTSPAPSTPDLSSQSGNCGWAVVRNDGRVMSVAVGDCAGAFLAEWLRLGVMDQALSPYEGCTTSTCSWVLQTRANQQTGNVAGYNSGGGNDVTYGDGRFAVSNNGQVTLTIENGVATDQNGNQFDTSNGEWLRYETPTAMESSTAVESTTVISETATAVVLSQLSSASATGSVLAAKIAPMTRATVQQVGAVVRQVAEVMAQTLAMIAAFKALLSQVRPPG